MFFAAVFCAFAYCVPSVTGNGDQGTQPIENVYPECFRGRKKTGIVVSEDNFKPIRGYAVCPFDAPNTNRNYFVRRNPDENVLFVVLHYTNKYFDFATTVELFTSNNIRGQVSTHYVIAKSYETPTDKQLLGVNYECIINSLTVTIFVWKTKSVFYSVSLIRRIINTYGFSETRIRDWRARTSVAPSM